MAFKSWAINLIYLDGGGYTRNEIKRGVNLIVFGGEKKGYVVLPTEVEQGAVIIVQRIKTDPTPNFATYPISIRASAQSTLSGQTEFLVALTYAGETAKFYWDATNATWQYMPPVELQIFAD